MNIERGPRRSSISNVEPTVACPSCDLGDRCRPGEPRTTVAKRRMRNLGGESYLCKDACLARRIVESERDASGKEWEVLAVSYGLGKKW